MKVSHSAATATSINAKACKPGTFLVNTVTGRIYIKSGETYIWPINGISIPIQDSKEPLRLMTQEEIAERVFKADYSPIDVRPAYISDLSTLKVGDLVVNEINRIGVIYKAINKVLAVAYLDGAYPRYLALDSVAKLRHLSPNESFTVSGS